MKSGQSATVIAVNDAKGTDRYLLQQTMKALLDSLTPQQRAEIRSKVIESSTGLDAATTQSASDRIRRN